MSKEPVTIPTSLYIFKRITCTGFWLNNWNNTHTVQERLSCISELFQFAREKKLKEPFNKTISISSSSEKTLLDTVEKWAESGKTIFVH